MVTHEDLARHRAWLQVAVPHRVLDHHEYLGEGWDNRVFLANGELIVRFAKDAESAQRLLIGGDLLQFLETSMPLRTPAVEAVADLSGVADGALMVYRLIPGGPLEDIEVSDDVVAALAQPLAGFLDALHSVPAELIGSIAIPRFTPQKWVERERALYQQTRAAVREALDDAMFERYEGWRRGYLADRASTAFEPCLVHGDLVPEHILINSNPWRISGVIDFGDAMWTDPVLDLAGMPEQMARSVASEMRTLSADDAVWQRRDAYRRIGPLHSIAAGQDGGSADLFRRGVEAIRNDLSTANERR